MNIKELSQRVLSETDNISSDYCYLEYANIIHKACKHCLVHRLDGKQLLDSVLKSRPELEKLIREIRVDFPEFEVQPKSNNEVRNFKTIGEEVYRDISDCDTAVDKIDTIREALFDAYHLGRRDERTGRVVNE